MSGKRKKEKISMKWRMMEIMLMCWFLPFCLVIMVAGYYVLSNQYGTAAERVADQLAYNNQICAERLNFGIAASRKATYDQTLEDGWKKYQQGDVTDHGLYYIWNNYITKEYRQTQCFSDVILWCYDDPEVINCSVVNNSAGGAYQHMLTYWNEDHEKVKDYLSTLDTSLGYIYLDGRLYMVRNLLDSTYYPFGALVMRLDLSYCFGPLIKSPMSDSLLIELDGKPIQLKGTLITDDRLGFSLSDIESGYHNEEGRLYAYDRQNAEYFDLKAVMEADEDVIFMPFYGYPFVFMGMLLCLVPLLMILFRVFNRNVTTPVEELMQGAETVEKGELGYQITKRQENLEFSYLTESFNRMSERLKYQFDHIYEEELALRDAKIMALQSNINPHFMNNTLEIINWEARLGGNEKVSRMIEALSTLMDGAMDRKKKSVVLLSEEMVYVNAYLYIIAERFGKRLTVTKELDPDIMQELVPRLILQPVIENAIEHGVRPTGRGTVILRGYAEGDYLYLKIINDGTLTEESKEKISRLLASDYDPGREAASRESAGNLGIANVNQRLKILYGESSGLTISMQDDTHVTACITIFRRTE